MYYFANSYYLGILMIIAGLIMKYRTGERPNLLGYKT